jgi:hypothetical protein
MDGLQQGDSIPVLMVIKKNPNFGKHELNIESGSILRCLAPQDDLLLQFNAPASPWS